MQVYLPESMYSQVKARRLPVSELLQKAVAAESFTGFARFSSGHSSCLKARPLVVQYAGVNGHGGLKGYSNSKRNLESAASFRHRLPTLLIQAGQAFHASGAI